MTTDPEEGAPDGAPANAPSAAEQGGAAPAPAPLAALGPGAQIAGEAAQATALAQGLSAAAAAEIGHAAAADADLTRQEIAGLHLSDRPDWMYLLREFQELYRNRSAGGSKPIRSHMKCVRDGIARVLAENPPVRPRPPETKPVVAHLFRALDNGRAETTASVVRTLQHVAPELCWLYGYDKVPVGLGRKYAYAEIAGPFGPVVTDRVILGLVLFGPRCTYPAHAHSGITESYVTLSGSVSENDAGVFAPGSLIFNPPGRMHRITTADHEPSLLAYAWHGPPEVLSGQKMAFSRAKRPRGA